MRKPTEIIAEATEDGCVTVSDFQSREKRFENCVDDFNETIERMFETTTIPEFLRENFEPTSVTYNGEVIK